jgi:hypothetical protein
MTDKTIAWMTMEKFDNRVSNSVGSSRIRVRWLLNYWTEAEEYIIGKKYQVHIYQKVYWGPMMDAFTGIKILDLCDPDWLENKPVFEFVDKVDAVTTSTEELAKYVRKIRPNALVKCIPDRIYLPEAIPVKTEYSDILKSVVWFGYSRNSHYLTRTFEEIIKRDLKLIIVADAPIEPPLMYRGKIDIHNVNYNYTAVNKEMIKYDAVLMPDPFGDERAKYKSNNKTLQAWALGMPVIRTPDDFNRLASKEVRVNEVKAKRKEVEEKWRVELSVKEYKDLNEEIKKRKKYV